MTEAHGVYISETPETCGISREMLAAHDVPCTSLMVMPLQSEELVVGHLVCITEGEEKLSEEHARLISLLKDPFTIALSNTLKHRSELKLYDRNFFWEATMRICGSLNIEKALWQSLLFLQDYIPADEAALLFFDPNKGTVTLNIQADNSGGRLVNYQAAYPPEIRALMEDVNLLEDFVDNRAEEHPLAKPILAAMGKDKSSVILVRLIVEDLWIGSVALWAHGWDKFNDEHLRLLKQLKQPFFIALSNSRRYTELLELKDLLADDNRYLQEELQKISGREIIGADFGLKDVMEKVRRVATLSSPVLLQGETGVGKEIIAAAVHNSSQRRDGPCIKVNCGAIPETLMDSELFGHEKGAFTGAVDQKRGRFERANGGTIFLDEIGELSPDAQVRLLRVLQEMEVERVGGTEPIEVDIRVIAATHRDLEAMIREGKFREDLYFRLNVFPIYIPTLRERSGDIPGLVQHFIQKKSRELQLASIPTLAPNAYDQLLAHHWPGNVRELENAVERAIILHREEPLSFSELGPKEESAVVPVFASDGKESFNLDQVTTDHIRKVLKITKGRVEGEGGAADLLGINPGTLRGRMRKLDISFGRNNK
jgi:transcriptional regulator with GAF, ATPase, and Fis domain